MIGGQIGWGLLQGALDFRVEQHRVDHARDRGGDLVLELEYIFHRAVEFLGPQARAGRSVDELTRDAQPLTRLSHAALEHIAHAELAPDLFRVDRLALVSE